MTASYLANADELQIQGAKPGDGGELHVYKVTAEIGRTSHTRDISLSASSIRLKTFPISQTFPARCWSAKSFTSRTESSWESTGNCRKILSLSKSTCWAGEKSLRSHLPHHQVLPSRLSRGDYFWNDRLRQSRSQHQQHQHLAISRRTWRESDPADVPARRHDLSIGFDSRPPGMGKVFIGRQIISTLLDNKHLWHDSGNYVQDNVRLKIHCW